MRSYLYAKQTANTNKLDHHPISREVWLANLDRARICGPNLKRMKGRNVSRVAMIARINPAYWLPTLWKNCEAKSGETAPRVFRMKPWPAMAEDEFSP